MGCWVFCILPSTSAAETPRIYSPVLTKHSLHRHNMRDNKVGQTTVWLSRQQNFETWVNNGTLPLRLRGAATTSQWTHFLNLLLSQRRISISAINIEYIRFYCTSNCQIWQQILRAGSDNDQRELWWGYRAFNMRTIPSIDVCRRQQICQPVISCLRWPGWGVCLRRRGLDTISDRLQTSGGWCVSSGN